MRTDTDGRRFGLAMAQDAQGSKIIPQTYGYVLHFYPYHRESKSLGPDGLASTERTLGLLLRNGRRVRASTLRRITKSLER